MNVLRLAVAGGAVGLGVYLLTRRGGGGPLGIDFVNPVPGATLTSGWGAPRDGGARQHRGIDLRAPKGAPIFAAAAGRVIHVDNTDSSNAGRFVTVQSAGSVGPVFLRYLHNDRNLVTVGQLVTQGQQIATVGDTGTVSAQPHLHLDVGVLAAGVEAFSRAFGIPNPPPDRALPGVAGAFLIPPQSLIPVSGYAANVIAEARARGVPLRTA
jgi:murein DD-endopeptidase MepM/ murein hydrolase activator NlpD